VLNKLSPGAVSVGDRNEMRSCIRQVLNCPISIKDLRLWKKLQYVIEKGSKK
jgi:hypothetical protein